MWDFLFLINGSFIPIFLFNDKVVNKHDFHWIEEDKRKVKLSFKVKHLLINAFNSKEFLLRL